MDLLGALESLRRPLDRELFPLAIGEAAEQDRCAEFIRQLDPRWDGSDTEMI